MMMDISEWEVTGQRQQREVFEDMQVEMEVGTKDCAHRRPLFIQWLERLSEATPKRGLPIKVEERDLSLLFNLLRRSHSLLPNSPPPERIVKLNVQPADTGARPWWDRIGRYSVVDA